MMRKAFAGDVSEPKWFKSSYSSGPDGDSCVEVAIAPRTVHVRDSKDVSGRLLVLTPAAWARFVTYASEH
ncbi:DUF397 domain-containing protein [Streptomyces albogriseolus]|uniref:DUF397 domain-containing protein n=1 Tax=Streptomyces albogriseolus TaxID=1887 RepID=UPI0037FF692B